MKNGEIERVPQCLSIRDMVARTHGTVRRQIDHCKEGDHLASVERQYTEPLLCLSWIVVGRYTSRRGAEHVHHCIGGY